MYSDQEIEELLHIPVLVTLPYYDQVWKYNNSYLSLYEDSGTSAPSFPFITGEPAFQTSGEIKMMLF